MKSKYILSVMVVAAAVVGVLYTVSRNNKAPTPITAPQQEETIAENPIYQHIHSMFKMPDGTILMGAHTGLFKSTDNGKTFDRAQIKSTDSSINPDGEFMNFAYDATNKILYGGTHDSGLLKSTDFGLTWNKTDSGVDGQDIHGLAVNPLDPNRLFAYSVNNGVFGTKDRATSWYKIDDGPKNSNVKGFAYMATLTSMDRGMGKINSTDIGYLWAGTGGGLFSSFSCFCGWTATPAVQQSTTVYALAADPLDKGAMLIAKKDGLSRTTDEGQTFSPVNAEVEDVGALWFDIENQKMVFAVTNSGVMYTSEDAGLSWNKTNP